MANTLEADIIRVLTDTRDQIRANMQVRNINASGRTSASIRVEPYEGGVRLVGGVDARHDVPNSPNIYGNDTAPIPTLEVGRKEGGVPKGFYYIIRQWSRDKGLRFSNDTERNTFSYFVAKKIANEGTKRNTNNQDIYSTPTQVARERIEQLLQSSLSNTMRAALGGERVTTLKGAFN